MYDGDARRVCRRGPAARLAGRSFAFVDFGFVSFFALLLLLRICLGGGTESEADDRQEVLKGRGGWRRTGGGGQGGRPHSREGSRAGK
jgi:hypothetical protein